ncbi:MAG: hypothetical protein K9N47_02225 [Prosthecobacter sp.]|uniref:hypothetical protein n=1 Tax=Prosthecobacter sp. TaxID=1965333 RepID=UPI0025DE889F|nr:hypothetical protein [Prosthecobacter sp.]MCF7784905.1 hypothetical protein [Prosthecobacter sp.]
MNRVLPQDIQILLFGLIIVAGLFLISLIRIFLLSRSNRRMRVENARMEKQAALQQMEVTSIHHDAMSWRAKTQRQFDALRSEFSHKLQQSDQGGTHALKDLNEAHKKALARISELEAALSAKPSAMVLPAPVTAALPKPPPPSQPGLPTMDSLRIQSLETELAAAKAEIASGRQHNAALQRSLLLARRRLPVPAMRKSAPRSAVRSS